jgi:mRNA interferase RelE/StbE
MKRWLLEFTLDAEHDLAKLDRKIRRRIIDKLDWLLENFDGIFPSVLSGEFREFYKLRVGDWRVIYKINWEKGIIIVCYIDRRDKIYKKRK